MLCPLSHRVPGTSAAWLTKVQAGVRRGGHRYEDEHVPLQGKFAANQTADAKEDRLIKLEEKTEVLRTGYKLSAYQDLTRKATSDKLIRISIGYAKDLCSLASGGAATLHLGSAPWLTQRLEVSRPTVT